MPSFHMVVTSGNLSITPPVAKCLRRDPAISTAFYLRGMSLARIFIVVL